MLLDNQEIIEIYQSTSDIFEFAEAIEREVLTKAGEQEPVFYTEEDFNAGQWWVKELNDATKNGTPDQQRAYCVVLNLLRQVKPLPAQAIPEWLMEMSEQMRTQDNRGTSHPFFQVRCKRYIVTEQGYNEHGYELCTDDGVIYRSYAAEEDDLEKLLIEDYPEFCEQWRIDQGDETIEDAISSFDPTDDDLPEGVRLVYVQETEEIVSTDLTEAGAKQFIRRKQHDYPKLYTYAESAYWSPQLRQLQDWIISLSASPKP